MAEFPLFISRTRIGTIVEHSETDVHALVAAGTWLGRFRSRGETIAAVPVPGAAPRPPVDVPAAREESPPCAAP